MRLQARQKTKTALLAIAVVIAMGSWLTLPACTKDSGRRGERGRVDTSKRTRGKRPKPPKKVPDLPARGPLAQRVLYQQAKGLLKAGRADKAIVVFRRAAAAHQGGLEASCYLGLGSALAEAGQKQEAVEAFQKVVRLRPSDATAYQMLAIGLRDAGKLAQAAAALEQASALEPDRLSTYQDLMALRLETKDTPSAQQVYARYEARRKLLIQRLGAPLAGKREDAAAALGQARDDETAKALITALGDQSASVRMAVIRALGQQGLPVAQKPLEALLKRSKHPHERRAIKRSLDAIKNAPPAPTVQTVPGKQTPKQTPEQTAGEKAAKAIP